MNKKIFLWSSAAAVALIVVLWIVLRMTPVGQTHNALSVLVPFALIIVSNEAISHLFSGRERKLADRVADVFSGPKRVVLGSAVREDFQPFQTSVNVERRFCVCDSFYRFLMDPRGTAVAGKYGAWTRMKRRRANLWSGYG
jgi:hypothetical protein